MTVREELLAKLAEERDGLLNELRSLDAAGWSRRSGEEDWTPRQQLLHLAAVEPQYSSAALAAAATPGASIPGVEQRTPNYDDAELWTPDRIMDDLTRIRRETLQAIAVIEDGQFDLRAMHGSFGELSVTQLLRAIYRHDRMHADQIAGRELTFQPRMARD